MRALMSGSSGIAVCIDEPVRMWTVESSGALACSAATARLALEGCIDTATVECESDEALAQLLRCTYQADRALKFAIIAVDQSGDLPDRIAARTAFDNRVSDPLVAKVAFERFDQLDVDDDTSTNIYRLLHASMERLRSAKAQTFVDIAADCVVTETDCGATGGVEMTAINHDGRTVVTLRERIIGRTLSKDVVDPKWGRVIATVGDLADGLSTSRIDAAGISSILVRSVLTCHTRTGVCSACYGRGEHGPARLGERIGKEAVTAINRPPGSSSIVSGSSAFRQTSVMEATADGRLGLIDCSTITNESGAVLVTGRAACAVITDDHGKELQRFKLPYGAELISKDRALVARGDRIAEWETYSTPILAEARGRVRLEDIVGDVSTRHGYGFLTGGFSAVTIQEGVDENGAPLRPAILLLDPDGRPALLDNGDEARYQLPVHAVLDVNDGDEVAAGEILARLPIQRAKGGLEQVAQVLNSSTFVVDDDAISPSEIQLLAERLCEEVQTSYWIQGNQIDGKHIEVVIRRVLQKAEIVEPGDSEYVKGEAVEMLDLADVNRTLQEKRLRPATARTLLSGIKQGKFAPSTVTAGSYQEMANLLTEAASTGSDDTLQGLKENVIVGRLIPAGTGGQLRRYQKVAAEHDADRVPDLADLIAEAARNATESTLKN